MSLPANNLLTLETRWPDHRDMLGEGLDDAATGALHKGVGVSDLVEVAEGVVDAAVGSLISLVLSRQHHHPLSSFASQVADQNLHERKESNPS